MHIDYRIDMDPSSTWRIVTVKESVKTHLPYVQELGDFISYGNFYTRRDGLPSYLIIYTLSGEGVLEYNGNTQYLPVGHFFWIDCLKPQHYYTSPEVGKWHSIWTQFYGPGCQYYYDSFMKANKGKNVGALSGDTSIAANIYELIRLYESPEVNTEIKASVLLASIMSECATACRCVRNEIPKYVKELRKYILANYTKNITLDILAQEFFLNKFYLQKMFKKYMGITPNDFLKNVRIEHAKELLRTTNLSIGNIASEVGIENASHLIRLFSHAEGSTPGEYRRRCN